MVKAIGKIHILGLKRPLTSAWLAQRLPFQAAPDWWFWCREIMPSPPFRRWHVHRKLHQHDWCWFQDPDLGAWWENHQTADLGYRWSRAISNDYFFVLPRSARHYCRVWRNRPGEFQQRQAMDEWNWQICKWEGLLFYLWTALTVDLSGLVLQQVNKMLVGNKCDLTSKKVRKYLFILFVISLNKYTK